MMLKVGIRYISVVLVSKLSSDGSYIDVMTSCTNYMNTMYNLIFCARKLSLCKGNSTMYIG